MVLEANTKRHGRFHQNGIAVWRHPKQPQAALHRPICAQLHGAIHTIEARHRIRRSASRRNGKASRQHCGIMRNPRDARRALAKSLLKAPIKRAPRPFIRGREKRAMQGGFIGKPSIGNPQRMAKQQGTRIFLRPGPDRRCQFPRTEAGGANHDRINRASCPPRHLGDRPGSASPIVEQRNRWARQVKIRRHLSHRLRQGAAKSIIRRHHAELPRPAGHGQSDHAAHLLFWRNAKRPHALPRLRSIIGEGKYWQARGLGNRRRARGFPARQRPNQANGAKADRAPRRIPRPHGIATCIEWDEFHAAVILFKQSQFCRLLQRLTKRRLLPRKRQQQRNPGARHIRWRGAWRGPHHDGGLRSTGRKRDKQPKRDKGDQA